IAANQVNLLAGFAELPDPIVAGVPAEAAQDRRLADTAGNGYQYDQVVIEVFGAQLSQEGVVFAVKSDHALDLLGVFDHVGERRVFRLGLGFSGALFLTGRGFCIVLFFVRLRFGRFGGLGLLVRGVGLALGPVILGILLGGAGVVGAGID